MFTCQFVLVFSHRLNDMIRSHSLVRNEPADSDFDPAASDPSTSDPTLPQFPLDPSLRPLRLAHHRASPTISHAATNFSITPTRGGRRSTMRGGEGGGLADPRDHTMGVTPNHIHQPPPRYSDSYTCAGTILYKYTYTCLDHFDMHAYTLIRIQIQTQLYSITD